MNLCEFECDFSTCVQLFCVCLAHHSLLSVIGKCDFAFDVIWERKSQPYIDVNFADYKHSHSNARINDRNGRYQVIIMSYTLKHAQFNVTTYIINYQVIK